MEYSRALLEIMFRLGIYRHLCLHSFHDRIEHEINEQNRNAQDGVEENFKLRCMHNLIIGQIDSATLPSSMQKYRSYLVEHLSWNVLAGKQMVPHLW